MTEIEVTHDFIENLRQSKELFEWTDLSIKQIKYKAPIVCTIHHLSIRINKPNRMNEKSDNFPFKKLNMVAAGGFIHNAIKNMHIKDIDIFIIGRENAIERIIEGLKFLGGSIYVTKNCITVYNGKTFQFILKWYDSIVDILNDFDLGSAMGAFDGEKVYVNAEGKFAFETGYNIVNLKKCRYSYKNRILKYNDRGFGLLHTELREGAKFILSHNSHDSAYAPDIKYHNPRIIGFYNLDNLLAEKNRYLYATTIKEIETGIIQLNLPDNLFDGCTDLEILKKYFTKDELKQIIDEGLSIKKFKPLLIGKQIEINILDGNIDKLSVPDMTPEEFYGPDYIYFGQQIKKAE